MIDMHSHIIPGVDDGCKNIEESLEMIKSACDIGVKQIVATPHYINNIYDVNKISIKSYIDKLNDMLKDKNMDIEIIQGNEIMLDINTLDMLKANNISTINNTRYVLIEFDMNILYSNIYEIITKYVDNGYIPLIAHPERYRYIQNDINIAKMLVNKGALLQMNISSLDNHYGRKANITVRKLLKKNLICTWGSDYHYTRENPYINISKYLKEIEHILNNPLNYMNVVLNNSRKILNNETI